MPAIPEVIWLRLKAMLVSGELGQVVLEIGAPGHVTAAQFNGEPVMAADEKLRRAVRGMVYDALREAGVAVPPPPPRAEPAPPPPAPAPAPAAAPAGQ